MSVSAHLEDDEHASVSDGGSESSVRPTLIRSNQFLTALPQPVQSLLTPHLATVRLERKDILFRAREPLRAAYFPTTAVVSLVARLESGETLDVGLVGRDGLAGTAVLPGIATTMFCDGLVSIPGAALKINSDVLRRELLANPVLFSAVGRFVQVLLVRTMQLSLCNAFHLVEQRCIRRLLVVGDLIGREEIPLTHESLAAMLGVRRPTVTGVLRSLLRAGLLDEQRGRIGIRDRAGLEAACCECYRVMRDEQRRVLGY
jgi:CRP-like cAMP-binding protein